MSLSAKGRADSDSENGSVAALKPARHLAVTTAVIGHDPQGGEGPEVSSLYFYLFIDFTLIPFKIEATGQGNTFFFSFFYTFSPAFPSYAAAT